ncbi:MAG: ABC transporter ATP-binding protein [Candidatus Bathyarchaeota archaeon]|nr:ABC transporter ATP-binding protein [Candidatus Bathyarchaeota archaeon]MDH5712600.1 ABC transporter ATP-binding protein [Candidatus Bathyarchaeota archaeon]
MAKHQLKGRKKPLTSRDLIEVKDLVKYFPIYSRGVLLKKQVGIVHAVDNIDFNIKRKETFGLVGESGCGKTTTARLILNLIDPTSGEVFFDGENIFEKFQSANKEEKLKLRRKMQLIFQNPYGSLDPRMTVFDIISEPFIIHKHIPKSQWKEKVYELLELVGLEEYHAERYPHEFSGGQRQRICIARALAVEPEFLIADEPVSSLDVSIRAQILNLLGELQERVGLTYLYISHDLSSVRQISHRVAVMYLGEIVELADTDELFKEPLHPYTTALVQAVPIPDPKAKSMKIILPGEVPSPINPPSGCRFHPRCPQAKPICREKKPELLLAKPKHTVACHLDS